MPDNQYMQPFYDSLSQGVQVAQHLTNAALQMRQLEQEKQAQQARMDLANREFQAQQQQTLGQQLANGARPVDQSGNTQMPTPGAANPASGLPGMENQPVSLPSTGTSAVPVDQSRTYQIGGQTLEAPSFQDQLNREVANKRAVEDAQRVPMGTKIAAMLGMSPDSTFTPEHAAGLGSLLRFANPPQQDNTPTVLHSQVIGDDKGNQTLINQLSDGTVKETPLKAKGKSDKFGNPEAEAASITAKSMSDNEKRQGAQQALKDYQKHVQLQSDVEDENRRLTHALNSNGTLYVNSDGKLRTFNQDHIDNSEEKNNLQDEMRERLATNNKRLPDIISDKQGAQNNYAVFSGNNGARPRQTAATQQAQAAAAPKPQQAAPAPASTPGPKQQPVATAPAPAKTTKVATQAQVQAYAAKKGVTPQQALTEFRQFGYTVQ